MYNLQDLYTAECMVCRLNSPKTFGLQNEWYTGYGSNKTYDGHTWIKILKIFRVFTLKSILLNKLNINWSIL